MKSRIDEGDGESRSKEYKELGLLAMPLRPRDFLPLVVFHLSQSFWCSSYFYTYRRTIVPLDILLTQYKTNGTVGGK